MLTEGSRFGERNLNTWYNASSQKSFKWIDFCVGQYTSTAQWFPLCTTRTLSVSKTGLRNILTALLKSQMLTEVQCTEKLLYDKHGYREQMASISYLYQHLCTNILDIDNKHAWWIYPADSACLALSHPQHSALSTLWGTRSLDPPIPQVIFPQVHELSLQRRSVSDRSTGKQRSLHLNHELPHGGLLPPPLQLTRRFWYSWGIEGQWPNYCWIFHFISFFFCHSQMAGR